MKFVEGKDRNQAEFFCIEQDNELRTIELFVKSLKLEDFGFTYNTDNIINNGRQSYDPADLLKLYIYGYLNRMRSSRILEKECEHNIEVMWLMKGLAPDHNTISNFRKDNPTQIRRVFQATVSLTKNFDLIGGKILAGDGTKLRAQNSKKNNFTHSKIEKNIAYIDAKLEEHEGLLINADDNAKKEIETKIKTYKSNKTKYEGFKEELDRTGEVQKSTSDPKSRQMITRNNITEVTYNVQFTVDAEYNIPIDYKVTNQNDSKAMGGMVRRAKTILKSSDFIAVFEKCTKKQKR